MKNILYIIPKNNYFSAHDNVGGHVSHAIAVIEYIKKKYNLVLCIGLESKETLLEKKGINHDVFDFNFINLFNIFLYIKLYIYINSNNIDTIYVRYSTKALFLLFFLSLLNLNLILEINSIPKVFGLKNLQYYIISKFNKIICISKTLKYKLVQSIKIKKDKIIVIENGVDKKRFLCKKLNKYNQPNTINIGYAGILKENYGLEYLIDVFNDLTNNKIQLNIAGIGPIKNQLIEQANKNNIKFYGKLDYTEIPFFLKDQDLLIYINKKSNRFQSPIKLFEYIAANKKIITVQSEQINKYFTNESCLFFDINSKETLKKVLINCCQKKYNLNVNYNLAIDWSDRMSKLERIL